jgi:integrase
MADIRKRKGSKGITYQVRYPSKATKSGYAYKTFATAKQAGEFREDSGARNTTRPRSSEITTVEQAVQRWLDVCEHEGRDGRDPVSPATLELYNRKVDLPHPRHRAKQAGSENGGFLGFLGDTHFVANHAENGGNL